MSLNGSDTQASANYFGFDDEFAPVSTVKESLAAKCPEQTSSPDSFTNINPFGDDFVCVETGGQDANKDSTTDATTTSSSSLMNGTSSFSDMGTSSLDGTDESKKENEIESQKLEKSAIFDADSGNGTEEVHEDTSVAAFGAQSLYQLMPEEKIKQLGLPKVVFTEATISTSDGSSSFEVVSSTESAEGRTRLLESTAEDLFSADSPSNLINAECSMLDLDTVDITDHSLNMHPNTIDISSIHRSDICEQQDDQALMAPTEVHNFFPDAVVDDLGAMVLADVLKPVDSSTSEEGSLPIVDSSVGTLNRALDSLTKPNVDRVFTSSPIPPRMRSPEDSELPGPLQRWREEYRNRIVAHEQQEKQDITQLKADAKAELDKWYEDRQHQIKSQHSIHVDNESSLLSLRLEKDETKTIWERMGNLALDLHRAHKVDDKKKDVSRMKHLLQLLRQRPPLKDVDVN